MWVNASHDLLLSNHIDRSNFAFAGVCPINTWFGDSPNYRSGPCESPNLMNLSFFKFSMFFHQFRAVPGLPNPHPNPPNLTIAIEPSPSLINFLEIDLVPAP